MIGQIKLTSLLKAFDKAFDTAFESRAAQQRYEFLRAFPPQSLKNLRVDQYVIGRRQPTFCQFAEPGTRLWANILGATASKFGIYYGKTSFDQTERYRFAEKFGATKEEAFSGVKSALCALVEDGRRERFAKIDQNPLSQMFKAKILSLYFPNQYINVCSGDHITELAGELGLEESALLSENQHMIVQWKLDNLITTDWSNPKFMTFLYNKFIRSANEQMHLKESEPKKPRVVDIDDLLERRRAIGAKSEKYAIKWERQRLKGLGYAPLVSLIKDKRKQPGCGYDFLSHSDPKEKRYIEIKTGGRNWKGAGSRFFLSQHEYEVSREPDNVNRYYFYVVTWKEEKPDLKEYLAADLYERCELLENGYLVVFQPREDE